MRIVLKGYYGFGNLGDDILLKVSYDLMKARFPQATFNVFSNQNKEHGSIKFNEYLHDLLGSPVEIIDWSTRLHADLVFNGGGGLYFDRKEGPFYCWFINRFLFMLGAKYAFRFDQLIRKLAGKPLGLTFNDRIGVGIGIETFTTTSTRYFEKLSELGSYRLLLVRDDFSVRQLKRFGIDGISMKFTDLAFLTMYWKPIHFKKRKNTVAIILMNLYEGKQVFYQTVRDFTVKARAGGYEVLFFSFDEECDKMFHQEFSAEKINTWKPHEKTLKEYLVDLGQCEQVISSRAHGAILGACMGCIPVCLDVSKKLSEVSAMFPQTSLLVSTDISGNELFEEVSQRFNQIDELRNILRDEVEMNEKLIKNGIKVLDTYLNV